MDTVAIYPRLLRRVRATLTDWVIAVLVIACWFFILPFLTDFPGQLKVALLAVIWLVLDPVLVSQTGGTPGHHLMNLRIQHKDSGENIGILRAILRSLSKIVTGAWSFIFALVTKKHQALHDLLSSTTVVLKNPETVSERERYNEREQDKGGFTYPSVLRKILIIIAYVVIVSLVFFSLIALMFPSDCFLANNCSESEELVLLVLDWVWFFGVAILIVYGWRSRLYGARRVRISDGEAIST